MDKHELLRRMYSLELFKRPRPKSSINLYVDDAAICGNIPLVREITQILAHEVAEAIPASGKEPRPNLIATKGFKESLFSQWLMVALEEKGFGSFVFKWYDKDYDPSTSKTEPYTYNFQHDDVVFLAAIDLGQLMRYDGFIRRLRLEGAHVEGAVCLFNSENLAPRDLRLPQIISLFGKEEIFSVLNGAEHCTTT